MNRDREFHSRRPFAGDVPIVPMTQADDNQAKAASSVAKSRRRVQFRVAIGHFFIAGIDSRSSRFFSVPFSRRVPASPGGVDRSFVDGEQCLAELPEAVKLGEGPILCWLTAILETGSQMRFACCERPTEMINACVKCSL